jgi:hypothetical protein
VSVSANGHIALHTLRKGLFVRALKLPPRSARSAGSGAKPGRGSGGGNGSGSAGRRPSLDAMDLAEQLKRAAPTPSAAAAGSQTQTPASAKAVSRASSAEAVPRLVQVSSDGTIVFYSHQSYKQVCAAIRAVRRAPLCSHPCMCVGGWCGVAGGG